MVCSSVRILECLSRMNHNKDSTENMRTRKRYPGIPYRHLVQSPLAFNSDLATSQLVELKGPQLIMVFVTKFLKLGVILVGGFLATHF